ncbi:MAG: hypothetical protein KF689_03045 [Gemmatimonadaceae bacterium]|nr:hypothetical protein [Gemmatimonadaceae bacterium]MCW5827551.1 hypothetical protein [Gemmatimonadaceae bacterium]
MNPDLTSVLYERKMPHGPLVRIRRVPAATTGAVAAVIEVDRRAGTPREAEGGIPPALMAVEGESEDAVVASLLPFADDDSAVARLLATRGIR